MAEEADDHLRVTFEAVELAMGDWAERLPWRA